MRLVQRALFSTLSMSRSAHRSSQPAPCTNVSQMKWPTTSPLLVIDLESTCWNNRAPPPGQRHEIIEIGWALLGSEADSPIITRAGTYLVKPIRSIVSEFCTELTTITPKLLEAEGMTLREAYNSLRSEVGSRKYTWCSWGDYDRNMIDRQCKGFGLESPFNPSHFNIKSLFKSMYRGSTEGYGMESAFKTIMGRNIEGTHHRGGDDAKNIAEILGRLISNKRASENQEGNIV